MPISPCGIRNKTTAITAGAIHDNVGYTPYEGRTITGWPVTVISRGRTVVRDGKLLVERGSGEFIARKSPGPFRIERKTSERFRLFESLIKDKENQAA